MRRLDELAGIFGPIMVESSLQRIKIGYYGLGTVFSAGHARHDASACFYFIKPVVLADKGGLITPTIQA